MWTTEKLKSLLKKIPSPTIESKNSQIPGNLELLFKKNLHYCQFENVHFLPFGEIIILQLKNVVVF